MKKLYEHPEAELLEIEAEDVIMSSTTLEGNETERDDVSGT